MIQEIKQVISEDLIGERIDRFLKNGFPDLSRTYIQQVLKEGFITVNAKSVKSNYRLREGDELVGQFVKEEEPIKAIAQNIPIDIVFEDDYLVVVNKPMDLVVHPAPGHPDGTLVNALVYHFGEKGLSGLNGPIRPGIVHRLDKDTTGLMIVAKDDITHGKLAAMLEKKAINRTYNAIVWGNPGSEGTIDKAIRRDHVHRQKMGVFRDGKPAVTHFKTLSSDGIFSLVEMVLESGRTHQIRVHLSSIGSAVLGDTVYGGCSKACNQVQPLSRGYAEKILSAAGRPMLHSIELSFTHPRTRRKINCSCPHPEDFTSVLKKIEDHR